MVRKCCIPLCGETYDKEYRDRQKRGEKCPSTFTCPNKNLLPEWQRKIPRANFVVTMQTVVCARHFHSDDILTHDIIKLPDGTVHKHERGRPKLRDGAVPKIFDGPKYLSELPKGKRPPPKQRLLGKRPPSGETSSNVAAKVSKLNENLQENTQPIEHFNKQIDALEPIDNSTEVTAENPSSMDINTPQEQVTEENSTNKVFTAATIHANPHQFKLPGKFWGVHCDGGENTAYAYLDSNMDAVKVVLFTDSLKPRVLINKKDIDLPEVNQQSEVEGLLKRVDAIRLCKGHTDEEARHPLFSKRCAGFIADSCSRAAVRCENCGKLRRYLHRKKQREDKKEKREQKLAKKLKTTTQKVGRLTKKVLTLQQQIRETKQEMKRVSKRKFEEIIGSIPKEQQELVRACFKAATTHKNGNRYTRQWVYECLLMKMMAPKLYRKLLRENKLPLPSIVTLNRYLKQINPAYGFQKSTFDLLKKKQEHFTESERHGCLLLDEMALDDAVSFKTDSLTVHGLVDLGEFTEEKDKTKRGDHALVLMYQPFQGQWVQAIGAFLSAGATKGSVLQHIVLEAIILLENSGFHVDCVATDGATWNRCMWELFGISKESSSCQHPSDYKRKLFFASDFPHLIKNLWARLTNKKILNLPEGQVKLSHWKAVLEKDKNKGIKRAFTITEDTLDPTNYQKMSVPMAMRFFGHTIKTAMQSYHEEGVPGLEDCQPSIDFIGRINDVVEAMNSQTPEQALRPNEDSRYHKTAKQRHMKEKAAKEALKKNKKTKAPRKAKQSANDDSDPKTYTGGAPFEFTTSTFLGLLVTVRSAIGLVKFLNKDLGYSYFLTRRINQDALEHFFGLIRGSCGSSNHPDPLLFIQVYRLISTYSLIKPPRGSNVTGGEMLEALISLEDLRSDNNNERRKELEDKLDLILDGGIPFEDDEFGITTDHCYLEKPIDIQALTVFGGYVSRKLRKLKPASECEQCFSSVCTSASTALEERERLYELRTYGGLLRPSLSLFELIYQMEEAVLKVTSKTPLHANLFFSMLDALACSPEAVQLIGCEVHKRQLTSSAITFFLTCRMHFVCRQANQSVSDKRRQKKNMAKLAKQGTGSQHTLESA